MRKNENYGSRSLFHDQCCPAFSSYSAYRLIILEGSEWLNDKEFKARRVFEGYCFSLGWWSEADGEKRRFGIDIGQAEKVGRLKTSNEQ